MLCPESVLVTGANRGIGLEFVKQFLALPQPPKHVFAGCRSPDAAKVRVYISFWSYMTATKIMAMPKKSRSKQNGKEIIYITKMFKNVN